MISLCDYVIDKDLDVVAVSESWLHGDERDNTVLADISNTFPITPLSMFHVRTIRGGVFVLARKGFLLLLQRPSGRERPLVTSCTSLFHSVLF